MNIQDFNRLVDERIEKIRSVLSKKAEEYATEDRLHNFKVAAKTLGVTSERALIGIYIKHFVSVLDLVDWIDNTPEKITSEIVDEKIGDSINYHILLEGLLRERIENMKDIDMNIKLPPFGTYLVKKK